LQNVHLHNLHGVPKISFELRMWLRIGLICFPTPFGTTSHLASLCFWVDGPKYYTFVPSVDSLLFSNQIGYKWNIFAYVIWLRTLVGFLVFGSIDNSFATTWVHPNLYNMVKSYSKNKNNHLTIQLETCRLFIKYTKAIWFT
jgi:hypothetical protein